MLVASLLADRDRYAPLLRVPDAVVVSGDIIQGASLNVEGWAEDIRGQYDVAYQLLAQLADRFADGDRSRVVLVPGNHDVCWNTARGAMLPVAPEREPQGIPGCLGPNGRHRWSWRDRQIFEIHDPSAYARRLDAYWDFVERFYDCAGLAYPISRDRGFNLFELDERRIVVAAFDSTFANDCFCDQGSLKPDAVANCGLLLRDSDTPYKLRIATWHHSIQGPPVNSDYMDVQSIHELIGAGFRMGLHGHQHLADVGAHYIHLPEQHAMAVVSAGSLCAGSRELPRGTDRQYNIVVIGDDFCRARVHVREMQRGNQFGQCTRGGLSGSGSLELEWELPADAVGRRIDLVDAQGQAVVLRAEAAFRNGDAAGASLMLEGTATPVGSYARALRLQVLRATRAWAALATLVDQPASPDELVALVEALEKSAQIERATIALAQHADRLELAAHIRRELQEKLDLRRMVKEVTT